MFPRYETSVFWKVDTKYENWQFRMFADLFTVSHSRGSLDYNLISRDSALVNESEDKINDKLYYGYTFFLLFRTVH